MEIEAGKQYQGNWGVVRRVLEVGPFHWPSQRDKKCVKYEVVFNPGRCKQAGKVGYIGACTLKRFQGWAEALVS